jgi:hypothetical protein
MVKRMLEDPQLIGLGGFGYHQISPPLKKGEKVSKW